MNKIKEYEKNLTEQLRHSKLDCCIGCGMKQGGLTALIEEVQKETARDMISITGRTQVEEDGVRIRGMYPIKILKQTYKKITGEDY